MKIDNSLPQQVHISPNEPAKHMPVENASRGQQKTPLMPSINKASSNNLDTLKSIYSEKDLKRLGLLECQTCENRTYVDGSDDPSVSFKSPAHIDPKASASAVMSHELEHVSNEQAKAKAENREVISQSVKLHTSICPECGISYVSGGVTNTVTKSKSDYGLSKELTKGLSLDMKI